MRTVYKNIFFLLCIIAAQQSYSQSLADSMTVAAPSGRFLFEQPQRIGKKTAEKQIAKDLRRVKKANDRYQAANKKLRKQLGKLDIHADTLQRFSPVHTKELDKLKQYDAILNKELQTTRYNESLAALRQQVIANQKDNRYIRQGLSQLPTGSPSFNPAVLKKIRIALDKKKHWESYYNDQDKVETELLYFLEKYQKGNPLSSPYTTASTPEELEQQGYQTNRSVRQGIQDKTGMDSEQYNKLITDQQEATQRAQLDKVKALKNEAEKAKEQVQGLQKAYHNIRYNSVRATPFRLRFKPVYNFNVQPGNIVTRNNSLFLSIGLEHKLSAQWSQAAGINNHVGFNIRKPYYFKYDNCFLFYYIRYELIWGIALQGGYEFNVYNRYATMATTTEQGNNPFADYLTRNHHNIAYLGLSKHYRINSSWQGTLLVGYDFLWHRVSSAQSTPWIVRLGVRKK